MSATSITRCFLAMVVIVCLSLHSGVGRAQNVVGDPTSIPEDLEGVILPFDRNLSRGMQHARKRIAAGEYTQAVRFLDKVLRQEQDTFLRIGENGEHTGLKAMARRVLRDLPSEGRQAYETTFAPIARRELQLAVAAGEVDAIRRIAGQYFYTPAGSEAAFLLAQLESDLGQHLAAALLYQQLLETPEAAARFEPQLSVLAATSFLAASNKPQALSIIEELRDKPFRAINIAGKEYQIRSPGQEPLDWLRKTVGEPSFSTSNYEEQWLTFRGNAARNGQVQGGLPHMRLQWRSRLLSHPKLEELYSEISMSLTQRAGVVPVAGVPLAVGDYIITRSPHSLVAVDFRTGKLVWQAEPQRMPEFERLIEVADKRLEEATATPTQEFSRRIWKDSLYSSISSDGQRVYVIRDLPSASLGRQGRTTMPLFNGRQQMGMPASNRLCAFELATEGKLVWEIDGAARQGPFKDTFFMGAPLAIGQSLYSLAETKDGEVFLAVLDRETGKLQWRQQLAEFESAIIGGANRRLQASTLSYDSGILVCPTGAGTVVGIDLSRKALAWAYRYPTKLDPIRAFHMQEASSDRSKGEWIDSAPTIANGRVLLTPPESDSLHCIDLETGKLLWKKQRENRLFVACVHNDRVVFIGKDGVSALRLDTGNWAWQAAKIPFPLGSVPTGRGFTSKGKYYLPLSSAEVIAVDLEIGAIVDRAVSRDGLLLGNLICHRGAVISQNGQYLTRFDQVEVLRSKSEQRIEQEPDDFEALRTLGEIAYNEGNLPRAVNLLIRAYNSLSTDLRTREVLGEALVVAMDNDFVNYREHLLLLEELHESVDGGLLTLHRLRSRGLLEINDPVGAFKACLQLFSTILESGDEHILQIGQHHTVEVSRWGRAQVAAIWGQADNVQKGQLTSLVEELTSTYADNTSVKQLEQLCDYFGSLDLLHSKTRDLARSYSESGRMLESQQKLLYLANSSSMKEIRAEAIARCSLGLHQLRFHRLANTFDEQLRTTYASVVCLEEQTGQQIYESLNAAGQISSLAWPYGKVETSTITPQNSGANRVPNQSSTHVRLERSDEVLGYCNVSLSARANEIVVSDSYGQDFFRATIHSNRNSRLQDPSHVYGVSHGSLLVVSLGEQIIAFDTMSSAKAGIATPLWRHSVISEYGDSEYQQRGQISGPSGRPGSKRTVRAQRNGKWIGMIGPVTHDSCVYQNQSRLVCVDSKTGKERWSRSDVPLGCDLFGDEQYVIAVPPSSKKALLFGAIDGRNLGETTSPRWSEQLATRGRQVIRWSKRADGRRVLSAFDVVAGETVWERDFERTARVDIAAARFVAVVEPSGHSVVMDTHDGHTLVDQEISPISKLKEVYLQAGAESFVLAIRQQNAQSTIRHLVGLNRSDYVVMSGLVYVYDRKTGNPSWVHPAEVRGESLMLYQPVDTPIIAFVGNATRRSNQGGKQGIQMLVLEKASGRQLVRKDDLPPSSGNYCSVRVSTLDTNEIIIDMSRKTVSLQFTDFPRPPEPPEMSGATGGRTRSGKKGLLGIGKKILGGS